MLNLEKMENNKKNDEKYIAFSATNKPHVTLQVLRNSKHNNDIIFFPYRVTIFPTLEKKGKAHYVINLLGASNNLTLHLKNFDFAKKKEFATSLAEHKLDYIHEAPENMDNNDCPYIEIEEIT